MNMFTSASKALDAYIEEFSGTQPTTSKYSRDVNELLTPKNTLQLTAERSMQTGHRDTGQEARLYEIRHMVNRAYEKVLADEGQRREVKSALKKSSRLLREISVDDISTPTSSNSETDLDLDSMTTDMLVTLKPGGKRSGRNEKGHMYSYRKKKPKTFSKSLESEELLNDLSRENAGAQNVMDFFKENRPWGYRSTGLDSLTNSSSDYTRGPDSLVQSERKARAPSFQTHLKRSLSPDRHSGIVHRNKGIGKSAKLTKFQPGHSARALPSYIGELEMSHVTDLGHSTPSWIGGLDQSTVIGQSDQTSVIGGLSRSAVSEGDRTPRWVERLTKPYRSQKDQSRNLSEGHQRQAPSWLGELDCSALASSGRKLPSYIGALDTSQVKSRVNEPGFNEHDERSTCDSGESSSSRNPSRVISWIEDLENGKDIVDHRNTAPSWVGDLEVSAYHGRANPSWIGEVSMSTVTQATEGNKMVDVPKHVPVKSKARSRSPSASSSSSQLSVADLHVTPRTGTVLRTDKSKRTLSFTRSLGHSSTGNSDVKVQSLRGDSSRESISKHSKVSLTGHSNVKVQSSHSGSRGSASKHSEVSRRNNSSRESKLRDSTSRNSIRGVNIGAGDSDSRSYKSASDHSEWSYSKDIKPGVYETKHVSNTSGTKALVNRYKPGVYENLSNTSDESRWRLRSCDVDDNLTESEVHVLAAYRGERGDNLHKQKEGSAGAATLPPLSLSPIKLCDQTNDRVTIDSPPNTDIILDGDRTWERIPAYKSPKFIQDLKTSSTIQDTSQGQKSSPRLTGSEQPGGMEALKNMLFTLQSVATSTENYLDESRTEATVENEDDESGGDIQQKEDKPANLSTVTKQLLAERFIAEPGGQSLEKAMLHLSRLKSLVAMGTKQGSPSGNE